MAFLATLQTARAVTFSCSANCKTCFGSGASQCMTCEPGYIMSSFACIPDTDSCLTDYEVDPRDNICKRTINDIDNPCEPSTFNDKLQQSTVDSCVSCAPGKLSRFFLHLKASPPSIVSLRHSDFESSDHIRNTRHFQFLIKSRFYIIFVGVKMVVRQISWQ